MKIIFFGTPAFSTPFLSALINDESVEVLAAVTQPDKPSGRGGSVTPCAVKVLAEEHGIKVLQPLSLKKDPDIQKQLEELQADVSIVVAYGKLIPQSILDIPKHGTINVHPSLLPLHRGPSPMQWAIREGDSETGVTIMVLDAGMDTGPLLASEHLSLDLEETYGSLVTKVHAVGPTLLLNTLKRFVAGDIVAVDQDDSKATLTTLLSRDDGRVVWDEGINAIERKVRAYQAWPGVWTMWGDERLKLSSVRVSDFLADVPAGTVTIHEGRMFVDSVDGTLEILEVQREGKPKMKAEAFIKGNAIIDGVQLV